MSEPLEISLLVGKSLAQWEVEAIEKALTERNIGRVAKSSRVCR
jgi:hypothetical protein